MTKLLIDRELLERIDRMMVAEGMEPDDGLRAALAAPRQQEGEGLEVVAWANPEDIVQDGYSHSFGVSSEQYPGREPLCRLSDAKQALAELRGELDAAREILAQHGRR